MSEAKNPWKSILAPSDGSIKARLVNSENNWPFFWAVDSRKRFALALEHNQNFLPKIPKFSNLEVSNQLLENGSSYFLVTLSTSDAIDIFYDFCLDLIHSAEEMSTEKDAFQCVIENLGRWHRLLRGERSSLSRNQVQGLYGELFVLLKLLKIDMNLAVDAWTGPFGTAKDFQFGNFSIEVKTTSSIDDLEVEISSEFQLDLIDCPALYLYCVSLQSENKSENTISNLIEEILGYLDDQLPLKTAFLHRLRAAGIDKIKEYDNFAFEVVGEHVYEVRDDFPRIVNASISNAVSQVQFRLDLQKCLIWATNFSELATRMS